MTSRRSDTLRLLLAMLAGLAGGWVGGSSGTMSAAIRPSKIASVADSSDPSKIQPSDVNPLICPASPIDGDMCLDRSGTTPTRTITWKIYDVDHWQEIATTSY